jgi:hypothetical protein
MSKLIRPAFTSTTLDEEKDNSSKIFTVRLNQEQINQLEWCKKVLSQPKDSTAFKQVFEIGLHVLQHDSTGKVLGIVFKNKLNNYRTGVIDPEDL